MSDPDPNLSTRSDDPKGNKDPDKGLLFFLILVFMTSLLLPHSMDRDQVPYSTFVDQLQTGQVESVQVGENRILYTLRSSTDSESISPPTRSTIPISHDPDLTSLLREQDVEYAALREDGSLGGMIRFLPLIFFFGFWLLLLFHNPKGSPNTFAMGKSRARIYAQGSTGITFADVAGVDEAKAELEEIVDFLQHSDKYVRLGARIPKGILLVGPPGTGKTLLAKAVAGEAHVPFFSISGSEFIELFVGVGASRVRDLFEQAKKQSPCIVFIDELDALGKSRTGPDPLHGANDEREQTLNQLLAEMDGFEVNAGVILLAATNRPHVLDPALLRPGRFDRQVVVDRPDKSGRLAILKIHSLPVVLAADVDLERLANCTPGFAGADLANLVNEAALLAARRDQLAVTMADFHEALERILTGLEKRSRVLTEPEKRTVAYHEAGHAIVGSLVPGSGSIEKISIVPRGMGSLGYTLQFPEEDRFLMVEDELRGQLAMLLAGRVTEEVILGRISTGAGDDIQKATDLAERYVSLYGMSQQLGPIAFERSPDPFLTGLAQTRRPISPQSAREIDQEVKRLIREAYQVARCVILRNRDLLEEIAQTLLEQEILEGSDLHQRLWRARPSMELTQWLQSGQTERSGALELSGIWNYSTWDSK